MARLHWVKDEARIERDRVLTAAAAYRARLVAWMKEQERNVVYLEENQHLTSEEKQLGQAMTSTELEKRLEKVVPGLIFRFNPFNPQMKALYYARRNEEPKYICAYHAGYMPERSVIKVREKEVWDPTQEKINRKDLPKHEYVPGKGFVFEGLRPGWKKVKEPWGESKRGWRTVLLRLVSAGITSPGILEATFGADNSAAWASHTGKKGIWVPW